ncbi:MAG: biotin synthase BioB, partial [Treponema sp.]|nr:biotin synthase BioB [Treponema sp.]
MNMRFSILGEKSLRGECLTRDECHQVLECPDEELERLSAEVYKVRYAYKGDKVSVQILTNAKSGNCGQDCAYCAQSAAAHTGIAAYPLAPYETFARNGALAKEKGAGRHCIGLSGLAFTDAQIEELCGHVERLRRSADTPICCSIGFLTVTQAARLKKAGVSRINHNLNTGKNFYKNICTTHSYEERVANRRMCRELGFELCSGGIVGMGETDDDIIDMLLALRELNPEAAPINILTPIRGTPLENADTSKLTSEYCVKVLSLARLLLPK